MEQIRYILNDIKKPFNVLLDFSKVNAPICSDTAKVLDIGRMYMIGKGAEKIVVLYESNAQIVDITRVFDNANNKKRERYISTMINKKALLQATKYLREGK
jgi:hypothetical protein